MNLVKATGPMILTSAFVARHMSELELRARAGSVEAQDEMERQAMQLATESLRVAKGNSLSRGEALNELKFGK